jgi:hypothetical protein
MAQCPLSPIPGRSRWECVAVEVAARGASAFRPKAYSDSPGGFEGFGAVGEDMGAADLPVFEVVDAVRAATLRGVR